ncbi:hypothetical protein EMIHUDRAFT_315817 [Emiliania huxleyi CCMP1516]|uniref:Uncharacterized protein n=2 Tax=Emiliania huxleyi TaxID=2903 RepID=A0A0D3JDH3_EMIH1|nr:hypothetical protein EMIHUDRAFT_315817 [Emiliania huxleyi CCMP1516]EOD21558.1 hypothetical protein EMIHUDRAFT_315817 [Emiliania huxleyi CCMP1516]|eukprot:XP_005773987.1 hypothetical protein EMIHUDRAFT_315817 [Emiliania huxleyi CCMP1516]
MRASGPAAAAWLVEAGLGPARDGWPPTSALALLVKMAAVAIAATVVQPFSAQASVVCRLLTCEGSARAARPASLREGMSLPRFDPAAKSCSLEPRPTLPSRLQLLSSPEDRCLICCLPAEVLTRCPPAIFYPHDSERESRSPESTESASGLASLSFRHSCHPMGRPEYRDLWLVSPSLDDTMKYSDRHLAGLSARPPDRVELNGAGSLGYGTGPSFG